MGSIVCVVEREPGILTRMLLAGQMSGLKSARGKLIHKIFLFTAKRRNPDDGNRNIQAVFVVCSVNVLC
jgi:hypothetical protein